jgi:hypothetical protein
MSNRSARWAIVLAPLLMVPTAAPSEPIVADMS